MARKNILVICVLIILGATCYFTLQHISIFQPTNIPQSTNLATIQKTTEGKYYPTIAEAKSSNPNNTKPILVKVTESW